MNFLGSSHEPARKKAFDNAWRGRGSPGFLRALSLSTANRQPGKISAALAGPTKAPRGLPSVLARSIVSRRPLYLDCRLRDFAGGQTCHALARGSGHRHRLQRNQCALYRGSQAQTQLRQSPSPPACRRAGTRTGNEFRSDRLHRRAASSCRRRRRAQSSPRCTQTGRRDASHGVCAIWTDRHLYVARVLQTARHPCHR